MPPFHSTLKSEAGNTMALHSMLKHFDYTTFSDFMRASGKAIRPFITTAIWMGMFYFLFTVFFAGGVLSVLSSDGQKLSFNNFLKGCGKLFFRFLRLAVYMIIILLFVTAIVFMPMGMIIASAYQTVQSEASLFYIILTGAIVYAFFFILVLMIGDYAKIILFRDDSKKSLKSVWASTKFVFKHFFGAYLLYILLYIAPIIFFVLYFQLDDAIGMVSGFTIFVMFLIQQIFVWLRIWTRIWFLGSELSYFGLAKKFEIPTIETATDQASGISPL